VAVTVWFWAAATGAWFVFMTCLSHQTGQQTSRVSRTLAEELHPLLPAADTERLNALLRKTAHVVVFGVLTVLLAATLHAGKAQHWRPAAGAVLVLWCWGDEATKRGVPGRHLSWLDVGLNGLGMVLGGAVVLLWARYVI